MGRNETAASAAGDPVKFSPGRANSYSTNVFHLISPPNTKISRREVTDKECSISLSVRPLFMGKIAGKEGRFTVIVLYFK
jgi:hypothetical protein